MTTTILSGKSRTPAHAPLVAVTRGQAIESIHYGSLIAIDEAGNTVVSAGEPQSRFFARSALKPLFTVGMLRAGLELDLDQVAQASSSHSGSAVHQATARRILERYGLTERDLENTLDLPYGKSERDAAIKEGNGPTRLAQNCSGKHAAMLATCVVNGWSTHGYLEHGHPMATLVREVVEEMTGEKILSAEITRDGCGSEIYPLTLVGMAHAFSALMTAPHGTPENTVVEAMRAHPELVGGDGRDVTAVMRAIPGAVAKEGAEAYQIIGLGNGSVIALKIADGGDRARIAAAIPALRQLGVPQDQLERLEPAPVLGWGVPVGILSGIFDTSE